MNRLTVATLAVATVFLSGWTSLPVAGVAPAQAQAAAATGATWLRVEATREELALALGEGHGAIDYGSFQWLQAAPSTRQLLANVFEVQAQEDAFVLDLGGERFDPLQRVPAGTPSLAGDGPDWRLVQLQGPTRQDWLDALRASGVQPVQYIHPYSYLVWGDRAAVESTARQAGVRWSGEFLAEYRVQPHLRGFDSSIRPTMALVSRHRDDAALREDLAAHGASVHSITPMTDHLAVAHFDIAGHRYLEVASVPGVLTVQYINQDAGPRSEMTNQSVVGNYGPPPGNTVFPGYATWLADTGYNGDGVIVGIVDGGIRTTHVDLASRISPCTSAGGSPTSCTTSNNAHGTHVAGAVAGTGATGTLNLGMLRGQGVAPGARVVQQRYPSFLGGGAGGMIPNGMLTIYRESSLSNAVLTNNSWGPTGTPQGYDIPTQQVDIVARDANPDLAGQQAVLNVWSIMNGNGDGAGACAPSALGSPDEAKNLFAVGSTKMQSGSAQIADIFDISSNSAHGNACDGRRVPHIVAPGCSTDSTTSTSDTAHGTSCGTSMASPVVSGAVAVFVEKYRDEEGSTPSPALIKAAFTAVAMNLNGFRNADNGIMGHRPDRFQGYGRLDLDAVANPDTAVYFLDQTEVFTATGQSFSRTLLADDPAEPMHIMLAWTDAHGHGTGGTTPAWVNNLDLTVTSSAGSFRGNVVGTDGWSATGGSADPRNNLEGVFLRPDQHNGSVDLTVLAANLAADALNPHTPGTPRQDFALVCYNCTAGSGFSLALTPPSASICAPANAVTTVNVSASAGFVTPVNLTATGLPGSATAGFAPTPVVPPGSSTLTIGNTGSIPAGNHVITVTGTAGAEVRTADFALSVTTGTPAVPTPTAPADGATDVVRVPTLSWGAAAGAVTYTAEVASDAGFADIVFSETTDETSATVAPALDAQTTYHWRVRTANACGNSVNSTVFTFTTAAGNDILLVDDDDNGPDTRALYTAVLDNLVGAGNYDVWDTNNTDTNEPTLADLSAYRSVIWFSGDAFDTAGTGVEAGPGAATEAALGTWLDGGACLLISSQDYRYDKGQTAFMTNYLGANITENDSGDYTSVTGQAGTLYEGLGPVTLTYTGLFSDFSDDMAAVNDGVLALVGNNGRGAAVAKQTEDYLSVYAAMGYEAADVASRTALVERFLDRCDTVGPSGTADLGLMLTDAPDPAQPGGTVTFGATVANFGPDAASSVTVVVELPPALTFVEGRLVAGAGDWNCAAAGSEVTCAMVAGSLPVGSFAAVLEIETVVGASAGGAVTTTASVSASGFNDPNPGNNAASTTTTIADDLFANGFECAPGFPGCATGVAGR